MKQLPPRVTFCMAFLLILVQHQLLAQVLNRPVEIIPDSISNTNELDIEAAVLDLFAQPDCFVISSITTNNNGAGIERFTTGPNLDIGLNSGLVLSTGNVNQIYGPNLSTNDASSNNNLADDADLQNLVSFPLFNAVYVSFDIIPTSDKFAFNMVFASEEYPEFVCSQYNDVVGIFVEQLGTGVKSNIAFIPGTLLPISINTLNSGTTGSFGSDPLCISLDHSDKYIDNSTIGSTNTSLDGYSRPLSIQVDGLETCAQYNVKIVIADGADKSLDSALFIENGSFVGANNIGIEGVGYYEDGSKRVVEGCEPAYVKFTRPDNYPISVPFVVDLSYSGTATFGKDYTALPRSITIPPNTMEYILPIEVLMDFGVDMYEQDETIIITTKSKQCSCSRNFISETLIIENRTPYTIDLAVCPDEVVTLPDGREVSGGGTYTGPYQPDPNYPDCDRVYYADITVQPIFDETFDLAFCPEDEKVLPTGDVITEEGQYKFTLTSRLTGCDSLVTYNVRFYEDQTSEKTYELCEGDEFVLPGTLEIIQPKAGEYNYEWQGYTANGCDSIIITKLKVNPSYYEAFTNTYCEGESATSPDGDTIIADSTINVAFKTRFGCDSIVTYNYIFNEINNVIDSETAYFCEEDVFDNPKFADISGLYIDTLLNQFGCDSIVTRPYELIPKQFESETISICGIREIELPSGKIVNSSGNYLDTLQNQYGCDSIVNYTVAMQEVQLANAFSPNNDGMNDILFISSPEACQVTDIKISVFNRWGVLVYQGDELTDPWSGKLPSGQQAPTDIYLVVGEYTLMDDFGNEETLEIKGSVQLLF